jgi:hypothetical protein
MPASMPFSGALQLQLAHRSGSGVAPCGRAGGELFATIDRRNCRQVLLKTKTSS